MQLNTNYWSPEDIQAFQLLLESEKKEDKIEWTSKIVNSKMPVLAIPTKQIKTICKQIEEGNFVDFLEKAPMYYYENSVIFGFLTAKIKNVQVLENYMDIFVLLIDNWATCDMFPVKITKENKDFFMRKALEYLESAQTYVRRFGWRILLSFIRKDDFTQEILEFLDKNSKESEYYVMMIMAWLVCDCLVYHRDETIAFLSEKKMSKFVQNKAICKARDSFRISKEDKELILQYRI